MLAQKVWDDEHYTNADFAFVYPFFNTTQINQLELEFLRLIKYSLTIKSSIYLKYYLELRTLFA